MCAVARYNDISSTADRGDIFIRAACWQKNGCPKQDFIVVPPPSNIMEVLKTTYHRGQNRTLIKYKSKYIVIKLCYLQITIVALDSYLWQ